MNDRLSQRRGEQLHDRFHRRRAAVLHPVPPLNTQLGARAMQDQLAYQMPHACLPHTHSLTVWLPAPPPIQWVRAHGAIGTGCCCWPCRCCNTCTPGTWHLHSRPASLTLPTYSTHNVPAVSRLGDGGATTLEIDSRLTVRSLPTSTKRPSLVRRRLLARY